MKKLLINAPGAGEWVMRRVGGVFAPANDHSISSHDQETDNIRGGFVVQHYMGASIIVHMAGGDERWCSRDMLWMLCHYVFRQLGCRLMIAPVKASNHLALSIDLRGGFRIEAVLRNAFVDDDMLLLTMDRDNCPWLKLLPKQYFPSGVIAKIKEPV